MVGRTETSSTGTAHAAEPRALPFSEPVPFRDLLVVDLGAVQRQLQRATDASIHFFYKDTPLLATTGSLTIGSTCPCQMQPVGAIDERHRRRRWMAAVRRNHAA